MATNQIIASNPRYRQARHPGWHHREGRKRAKSDKLAKLTVNFGDHKRSILAGMRKERLDPKAEIEGRQALFVVNLGPRSVAGQVSEGMLFDLGYADGLVPVLPVPEKPLPAGSRAG
jgi:tRNA-binding protein